MGLVNTIRNLGAASRDRASETLTAVRKSVQFLFAGAAACGEINPLASHVRLVYRVAAVKKSSPFSSYESDRSRYIPPVVMREYESSVLRLWVPVLTTPSRSNFSAGSIPRDWMFFQFCQNFKAVALRTIIAMILICPVTGRIRHKGSHTRRPLRQACQPLKHAVALGRPHAI